MGAEEAPSARAALEAARAALDAQQAVAGVLAEAGTLAEATPRLLRAIGESLRWELGALWSVDEGAEVLRCEQVWQVGGREVEEFRRLSLESAFPLGVGLPGRVWAKGAPAWIPDLAKEEGSFPRADSAARAGLRAWFGFPMVRRDEVLGVIEFFNQAVREPDEELLGRIGSFGDQIGQFIARRRAEEAVQDSEARKTAMLEAALDCVIGMDHRGCVVEFNPAAERTFGYERSAVVGQEMAELIIPPALRDGHRQALARYLRTGRGPLIGQRIEISGMRSDGEEFPVELTITRVPGGKTPLFTGFIRDITERKRAEQERTELLARERETRQRAESAHRRAEFLSEASRVLNGSLDHAETLASVARLAVGAIADWCVIDVVDERGAIRRLASAHADPAREQLASGLEHRHATVDEGGEAASVIRSGQPRLLREITDAALESSVPDPADLSVLRELGCRSAMIVPLTAGGRALGAMTLASATGDRLFDDDDLGLARELGVRAAAALDNARLHRERAHIARTLQLSLLAPELPDVPGVAVETLFRPAGEGSEVGGDFYDLFALGPGGWGVLMGDVVGKGVEAAAITALARYTVRAAAVREPAPERVLELLNEAVLGQRSADEFCTACYATLRLEDGAARMRLASGGHPLPLRIRADGHAEEVGGAGDAIGIQPDPQLVEQEIELRPGDAVVFYTDGLTDAWAPASTFSVADLAALTRDHVSAGPAAMIAAIEGSQLGPERGPPRDDVALLVLQLDDHT